MPSSGHPSYPNPIIQEAICEIAFRLQDNVLWDPRWSGDFFVAVKEEFPNLQSIPTQPLFSFQIGPSALPPQPINVFRFGHASRPVLLQLSDNRIVVNVLPKYSGWEQVSNDIQYAWERIINVINPVAITRIGLRYINRIERSAPGETLGKWLVATDYVPQGVLDSLSGALLSQVQAKLDDNNRIAVVVGELDTPPNANGAFIFDIDRTLEREIAPDAATLLAETSRLHDDVWKSFSSARGERLEKLLKGIPV